MINVYISGYADLNDPENRKLFYDKKAELHAKGYNAIVPHEICLGAEKDADKCQRLKLRKLRECNAYYRLKESLFKVGKEYDPDNELELSTAWELGLQEITD